MNMVDFCVNYVINTTDISDYALELAFSNPVNGHGYPSWMDIENDSNYSVEQGIREKVIYKMIGPLLNVAGGTTEIIDLTRAKIKYVGTGEIHVNVPDTLTGGREILSVLGVYPVDLNSITAGGTSTATCGVGAINNAMSSLVGSLTNNSVSPTYSVTSRTGRNSFLIKANGAMILNLAAKVILSYDEEFTVISPKAYPYFAELTELGTKVYIYKKCRRGLKEAVKKYGYSLDSMQDEIDSYSGASAEFMQYYKDKIRKVLAYADKRSVSDIIAMTTPRRLS